MNKLYLASYLVEIQRQGFTVNMPIVTNHVPTYTPSHKHYSNKHTHTYSCRHTLHTQTTKPVSLYSSKALKVV